MSNQKELLKAQLKAETDYFKKMALVKHALYMFGNHEDDNGIDFDVAQADSNDFISEAAELMGVEYEQVADENKRTREQQEIIDRLAANGRFGITGFAMLSNYIDAYSTIVNYCYDGRGSTPILTPPLYAYFVDDSTIAGTDIENLKGKLLHIPMAATLYFFAIHPNISPVGEAALTESDRKEIIKIFKRMDAFYRANTDAYKNLDEFARAFVESEHPPDQQEVIERLTSVLPEKYVIPNNKLANTMTKGIIDVGPITLEESKKGAKKVIETSCILSYEGDNVHLSGRQPYTEYDRNVYSAVSSLYVYGDPSHIVTPAMVYRAMTGLTDTEKPTAGQLAAVTRSLDKMRFIRARIDCTAELQARRITLNSRQINNGEIDTYLLAAEAIKVKAGGQTVKAYQIIKMPILYEYASAVNQVLTVSISVLDVKEIIESTTDGIKKLSIGARLPNTESRILIKGYMIRRIEGMKGKNGLHNPVIALYDYQKDNEPHQGLYSIAGNPDPTRTEANRIRGDAEKMLAYWTATGYIKAFEAQTERKKITGYKITV